MISPITPPTELVAQWLKGCPRETALHVATQAAQWGWDQRGAATEADLQQARDEELNACCEWLDFYSSATNARDLRLVRRPKPTRLKEQALNTLDEMSNCMGAGFIPKRSDLDTIRRALEALPND